jgi:hypothetical protein
VPVVEWVSAALNAPGAAETLLAGVARLRSRSREDDPAPGDWATRAAAYGHFRDASIRSLANLELLVATGVPPRWLGAMWSWPQALRAFPRYIDSMHDGLLALHEIAMVGEFDVFDAASTVAEGLGQVGQLFTASKAARKPQSPEFREELAATHQAVIAFVIAARADLQKDRPT